MVSFHPYLQLATAVVLNALQPHVTVSGKNQMKLLQRSTVRLEFSDASDQVSQRGGGGR